MTSTATATHPIDAAAGADDPRAGALTAVVLSDGQLGDAYRTARILQTITPHVVVLDRTIGPSAHAPAAIDGIELVLADWHAEPGVIPAAVRTPWFLVVGAGERPLCRRPDLLRAELAATSASSLRFDAVGGAPRRVMRTAPRSGTPSPTRHLALVERPLGDGWDPEPICPVCEEVAGFAPLAVELALRSRAVGWSHPPDGWELRDRHRFTCRSCGAMDRDRLSWLLLDELLHAAPAPPRTLEIAPSPSLSPRLRSRLGSRYRSADRFRTDVDDRIDLQHLPHDDDSLDLLICSHVLEHVPDDVAAIREIRRVLAPGGTAVLLVPISTALTGIVEDPSIDDPAERTARFGQDDHVRVHTARSFVQRLEAAGLDVETFGAEQVGVELLEQFAIPATGRLYVARA